MQLKFVEEPKLKEIFNLIVSNQYTALQIHRGFGKTEEGIWLACYIVACRPINPFSGVPMVEGLIITSADESLNTLSSRIKKYFYEDERLRTLLPDVAQNQTEDKKNTYWNKSEMYFNNGSIIHLRTILSKSIRGNHVDWCWGDDLVGENSAIVDSKIHEIWFGAVDGTTTAKKALTFVTGTPKRLTDVMESMNKSSGYAFKKYPIIDGEGEVISKRWDTKKVEDTKKRIGSVLFQCNPGYAPILMSDFTYKDIKDVKEGDEIIGYKFGDGKKTRLVKSIVKHNFSRIAETVKMKMSNGDEIICTPEHRWFTGRFGTEKIPNNHTFTRKAYKSANVGSKLIKVSNLKENISNEEQRLWDYLGGIIDGEGSCMYGSLKISQCPIHNPEVHSRIKETLEKLELDYKLYKNYLFVINGGREIKAKIIRNSNLAKKHQLIDTIFENPQRIKLEQPRVETISKHKTERVYALETTTGNYVIWGYASKNCEYMLNPIDDSTSLIKRDWILQCQTSKFKTNTSRPNWAKAVYLGVDFAFSDRITADKSVFSIIAEYQLDGKTYYVILDTITKKGLSGMEQMALINSLHEVYKFDLIGLEENSIKAISKDIRKSYGHLPTKRFWTGTNDEKTEVSQNMKEYTTVGKRNLILRLGTCFENKEIIIPTGDELSKKNSELILSECMTYAMEEGKLVEIGPHGDVPIALGYALETAKRWGKGFLLF